MLNRRMFLTELGRRTFAVAILGGVLVSCSKSDDKSTSGRAATSDDEAVDAGGPTSRAARGGLAWRRVMLDFVSAYVLVRGREAAVVDTGTEGSETEIGQALSALGAGWDDVDHVVLTHSHPDHAGSIGAVMESATSATAYAGEADIAGIRSPRPLRAVGDGDEVFGLRVIATPGHTLGHISVLDPQSGLLVVGDALTNEGSRLTGSRPEFTADAAQAEASVRKLAALRFATVVFGHGDPINRAADKAVAALASTL